jgi:hypothetical protein
LTWRAQQLLAQPGSFNNQCPQAYNIKLLPCAVSYACTANCLVCRRQLEKTTVITWKPPAKP